MSTIQLNKFYGWDEAVTNRNAREGIVLVNEEEMRVKHPSG